MSDTLIFSIIFLAGVFVASCSQILLKSAAGKEYKTKLGEYLNWRVIVAYGVFGMSAMVGMFVLRFIPISLVTILESATYVFVPVLSLVFLKEKLKKQQVFGICLIVLGIVIFNL